MPLDFKNNRNHKRSRSSSSHRDKRPTYRRERIEKN